MNVRVCYHRHLMLRTCFRLFAFALAVLTCAAASVEKIGPDLYAYISESDSSANSTFLIGDKDILVVDTGLNEQEGHRLLDQIRKISPLPVRWIVNTHYHADHRGGNSAFGPDATVISTRYTRLRVLEALEAQSAKEAHGPSPDYLLNENVERDLILYVGSHEVRIYQPGPAHTRGDLVVYFPEQRAISTGDLFLTNSCPYMDDGDMENWVAALDRILALPVDHVVPGHFNVATKNDVRLFRDYLADLRDQVAAMHRQGLPLAQMKQKLDLRKYAALRQFPQYEATFADNAAAYYRQLQIRGPATPANSH
jgi:cyclase